MSDQAPAIAGSWAWVDLAFAAVMLLSAAVGLWRGLVFEVLSLLGWVVAYVVAQVSAPVVAQSLPIGAPGSPLNYAASFAASFIVAMIVWTIAVKLLRAVLHATPLQVVDRVLGAGFGVLRGGVILLVVATVVMLTPMAKSPAWRQSQGAGWLSAALHVLKPMLPEALGRHLPERT
jgi:membrane protein required for colicin V production